MEVELWTEYGIGMLIFFLRFFARLKVVGRAGLAWDDFFSFVAMILWSCDAALIHIMVEYGTFVGLNTQSAAVLADSEAARLEVGSKALFVAWLTYTTLIWSLKASLLCFYDRLTFGLWQQKFIYIMKYLMLAAYVAAIMTLFLHCRPIQRNWQIKPYAGDACAVTVLNYIVIATLNVGTDICLLTVPIPLVWAVRLPLARKLIIALLLCSGIFITIAALLRCVLSLSNVRQIENSAIWATRETFVSVIVISTPAIKPLFKADIWLSSSNANNFGRSKTLDGRNSDATLVVDDFGFLSSAETQLERDSEPHPGMPWRKGERKVARDSATTIYTVRSAHPSPMEMGNLRSHDMEESITSPPPQQTRNVDEEQGITGDGNWDGGLAINVTKVYSTDQQGSETRIDEEMGRVADVNCFDQLSPRSPMISPVMDNRITTRTATGTFTTVSAGVIKKGNPNGRLSKAGRMLGITLGGYGDS